MVDISVGPLTQAQYELIQMIEHLGASVENTQTVIKAGEILDKLERLEVEHETVKQMLEYQNAINGEASALLKQALYAVEHPYTNHPIPRKEIADKIKEYLNA